MNFQNKRCLVTGGAGFIGSNLAIALVTEGAQVTVVDNMDPDCGGNLFNLEPIKNKFEMVKKDLLDYPVDNENFDFIFNLAGNVSHQDSMSAPLRDLHANSLVHLQFLERLRRMKSQAVIVYASTRQVYGQPLYVPVDEAHPVSPMDINGIHKFAGEHYHLLYSRVHGLKATALRLTNTYGPRQLIAHARQGFMGWFMNRALKGETIQVFGDGRQRRDFTFVEDVVSAFLFAAQSPKCFGNTYNLSGPCHELGSVARLFVEILGKGKVEIVPFPMERKRIDIGDYTGTSKNFERVAGWIPKMNLKDGLHTMIEYYSKNSEHYL